MFLLAGCLTTLGLDVAMSIQISSVPLVSSFGNFTPEVIAVFSIGAGGKLSFHRFIGVSSYFYKLIQHRSI